MNLDTTELLNNVQKMTKEFSTQVPATTTSSDTEQSSKPTTLFMGLTMSAIVFSFLFSMVGLAYFRYGKKNQSFLFMISGILLMVYPYVVANTSYSILTGGIICSIPFLFKRFS